MNVTVPAETEKKKKKSYGPRFAVVLIEPLRTEVEGWMDTVRIDGSIESRPSIPRPGSTFLKEIPLVYPVILLVLNNIVLPGLKHIPENNFYEAVLQLIPLHVDAPYKKYCFRY